MCQIHYTETMPAGNIIAKKHVVSWGEELRSHCFSRLVEREAFFGINVQMDYV